MTASGASSDEILVSLRGIRKYFPIREGLLQKVAGHVRAVDGVSFDIRRRETVGLVGESGCGKTTLGRCIGGLTAPTGGGVFFRLPRAEADRLDELGAIRAEERDAGQRAELARIERAHRVDRMSGAGWKDYRRNCQVVFQDAYSSLNPRHLVEDIVARPLRVHREASGSALQRRVVELLESVGLGRQHLRRFPHEFSGGQRQRISIARALALDPELIVLDEPTSALDVSVQAQILNLLHELQLERGLSYLFVSHDLGVVRLMSDRIVVMYLGQVVEEGPAEDVFRSPRHPYTRALLRATPTFAAGSQLAMKGLDGSIPDPARPPQGCRFHTRCAVATPRCGWQIDDAIAWLEPRIAVEHVSRRSDFEAELGFADEAGAARAASALTGGDVPAAMRDAIRAIRIDRHSVHLAFEALDPVALGEVAPSHYSSCILETPGTGA